MEGMKEDERMYLKKNSFGVTCNECKKMVSLKLYKCLFCKGMELCEECYMGWKHPEHDKWLSKDSITKKWGIAGSRSGFDYNRYKQVFKAICELQ